MKIHQFVAACSLVVSVAAFAAGQKDKHGHTHDPHHGGVVVEVRDMEFELVAKPETIRLYLRQHGKPMNVSEASAKLTLLSGPQKQEAQLKPAGDRLEVTGSFAVAPGTKALVAVTGVGKSVATARFELK